MDGGKEADLIKKLNEKIRFLEEDLRTQIDQTLKIQEEAKIKAEDHRGTTKRKTGNYRGNGNTSNNK